MTDSDYPRQIWVNGENLCEHCESHGRMTCPLHRPKPAFTATGLTQPITPKKRWWRR